jgi:nitrous oxidase accessory protein NosD
LFGNKTANNAAQGILNQSTNGTVIRNNLSVRNSRSGIAVLHSTNVLVALNRAFGNRPDFYWDGFGTETWSNNACRNALPRALCAHVK